MASKCPNCGKELKWYNMKADCPDCGISIPNYNWEARLEEDNLNAEAKFAVFYKTLNILKYSIFGTKLRIARIVMSVIPILGLLLPWARIASDKTTLNLDLLGIFTDGENTISFVQVLMADFKGLFSALSAESFSGPVSFFMFGIVALLICVLVAVVAFFLIFITFKKPKTKAMWITDIISIIFAVISAVLFILSNSKITGSFSFLTYEFENASSGALWGIYVFILLLAVPLIGNILVSKAPIKTEEELEAERLEKVRIKEEKEEQDRIKKEAARLEAQKKAEEEQAEKLRKAKEALANKDKK